MPKLPRAAPLVFKTPENQIAVLGREWKQLFSLPDCDWFSPVKRDFPLVLYCEGTRSSWEGFFPPCHFLPASVKPEKSSPAEGGCESTWQVLQGSIKNIRYAQDFCATPHSRQWYVKQKHPGIRGRPAKLSFTDQGEQEEGSFDPLQPPSLSVKVSQVLLFL